MDNRQPVILTYLLTNTSFHFWLEMFPLSYINFSYTHKHTWTFAYLWNFLPRQSYSHGNLPCCPAVLFGHSASAPSGPTLPVPWGLFPLLHQVTCTTSSTPANPLEPHSRLLNYQHLQPFLLPPKLKPASPYNLLWEAAPSHILGETYGGCFQAIHPLPSSKKTTTTSPLEIMTFSCKILNLSLSQHSATSWSLLYLPKTLDSSLQCSSLSES